MKPICLKALGLSLRVVASLAVLALAWAPAGADARGAAQGEPQAQIEELSRVLGVTPAEIEAMGLSPEEIERLLTGFTAETVVVGSRGQPRSVTASPVPVDVFSPADLTSQGAINLQDQLRTVVPSFNVNTQPISDASTVVRPANAAQPGTGPHAGPGQRQAPPPRVDHRLARRQRRGVSDRRGPTSRPFRRSRCGRSRCFGTVRRRSTARTPSPA